MSKRRLRRLMFKTVLKKRYTGCADEFNLCPMFLPSTIHMAHIQNPKVMISLVSFILLFSVYLFIPSGYAIQAIDTSSFYENVESASDHAPGSAQVNLSPETEVNADEILPAAEDVVKSDAQPEVNEEILRLKKNEGLQALFARSTVDFADGESLKILKAVSKVVNPARLNVGTEVTFTSSDRMFEEVSIQISRTSSVIAYRDENGTLKAVKSELELTSKPAAIEGKIKGSFVQTAAKSNVPRRIINQFISAFEGTVDFKRDINDKTTFKVVYDEKRTPDGKAIETGHMLYGSLTIGNRIIHRYYFTDGSGYADFYDEKGKSARRFLSVRPTAYTRVSSAYGTRFHPVLKKKIMHWGVDMAAPQGTPVYAAGDGRIMVKGYQGDYGHYIQIKHNPRYSTAYAHMSRYANGVGPGAYVKKGRVIGYVGSTGRSTGPHLHFELIKDGKRVNALKEKAVIEKALTRKDKERFNRFTQNVKEKYLAAKEEEAQIIAAKTQVALGHL